MTSKSTLRAVLGDRTVAYHHILARIAGSAAGGVFFSQLLYWDGYYAHQFGSDWDGWFFKSAEDMYDDTACSRREQDDTRDRLLERGLIETDRRGVPMRTFYRINFDNLEKAIAEAETAFIELRRKRESAKKAMLEQRSQKSKALTILADRSAFTAEAIAWAEQWLAAHPPKPRRRPSQFAQGVQTETDSQFVQGVQTSSRDAVQTSLPDGVQTSSRDAVQTIYESTDEIKNESVMKDEAHSEKLESKSQFSPALSAQALWEKVLAELPLRMTKATFDTWLARTTAVSYQNGSGPPTLLVATPNQYGPHWLNGRLAPLIINTVSFLVGKQVNVHFIFQERHSEEP